jgi:hypothetical protein
MNALDATTVALFPLVFQIPDNRVAALVQGAILQGLA